MHAHRHNTCAHARLPVGRHPWSSPIMLVVSVANISFVAPCPAPPPSRFISFALSIPPRRWRGRWQGPPDRGADPRFLGEWRPPHHLGLCQQRPAPRRQAGPAGHQGQPHRHLPQGMFILVWTSILKQPSYLFNLKTLQKRRGQSSLSQSRCHSALVPRFLLSAPGIMGLASTHAVAAVSRLFPGAQPMTVEIFFLP